MKSFADKHLCKLEKKLNVFVFFFIILYLVRVPTCRVAGCRAMGKDLSWPPSKSNDLELYELPTVGSILPKLPPKVLTILSPVSKTFDKL